MALAPTAINNLAIAPRKQQRGEDAVMGAGPAAPLAPPTDGFNSLPTGTVQREFERFNTARDEQRDAVAGSQAGIDAAINRSEQLRQQNDQRIQAAQNAANALFDPVLSQFQGLFNQDTVSDAQRNNMVGAIRDNAAANNSVQQQQIRDQFASQGLSGSTVGARNLMEAGRGFTRDANAAVAGLDIDIARQNRADQLAALGGMAAASGSLAGLNNQTLGMGTQNNQLQQQLGLQGAGMSGSFGLSQDFSPFSEMPFLAADDARGQMMQDRAIAMEELRRQGDPLFQIGRGLTNAISNGIPGFLFNQLGMNEFVGGT